MNEDHLDPDIHLWPQEAPECYYDMRVLIGGIYGHVIDPEKSVEADYTRVDDMISKWVYKYTDCGAAVQLADCHVTVSGYCEGSDGVLDSYTLTWPFTQADWFEALGQCEQDSHQEWLMTHGCEGCEAHWGARVHGDGLNPVWLDCPKCGGEGVVI